MALKLCLKQQDGEKASIRQKVGIHSLQNIKNGEGLETIQLVASQEMVLS